MVPARAGGLTFSDREGDRGVHKGVREHERLQVRTDDMAGRRTDGSGVVTGTSLTHTKAGNASALSLVAATSSVSESESETLA